MTRQDISNLIVQDEWQPVRIAPYDGHSPSRCWKIAQGMIIRVRPRPTMRAFGDPTTKVYEIHPEDFQSMPHEPDGTNFIMDYQIQAD